MELHNDEKCCQKTMQTKKKMAETFLRIHNADDVVLQTEAF